MTTQLNGDLLQANDFCTVSSNRKLKGSGLQTGDIVMVATHKVAPVSAKDPYLQRVYVVVLLFKEDKLLVPNETNEYKAFLVDPRNLTKLSADQQKEFYEKLKIQYGHSDTTN